MKWSEVSEQVVQFINNKLLLAKVNRRLSDAETTILRAAWDGLTYEEIADETEYTASYIQAGLANNMWRLLTDVMGDGEVITKKKFRFFMEWRLSTELGLAPHEGKIRGEAVLLGNPPDIEYFYGRKEELQMLKSSVTRNRIVVLSGIDGVGKTALSTKLLEGLKPRSKEGFDYLIWKSIHYGPSLESLVKELLKLLHLDQREFGELDSEESRETKLIGHFRSNRILLVLDEAESLLERNDATGKFAYKPEAEGYTSFFRRIIEDQCNSCVLLTSRELFEDINQIEFTNRSVQTIRLKGLVAEDAIEFIESRGLSVTPEWSELIKIYQGIPYAIDMLTSQVQRLFGGDVKEFFNYKTSLMSDYIQKVFGRELSYADGLSSLKSKIVDYLYIHADAGKLVSFQNLLKGLSKTEKFSILDFKKALEGLAASSIVEVQTEPKTKEESYCVNPLVIKYLSKGQLTTISSQPV